MKRIQLIVFCVLAFSGWTTGQIPMETIAPARCQSAMRSNESTPGSSESGMCPAEPKEDDRSMVQNVGYGAEISGGSVSEVDGTPAPDSATNGESFHGSQTVQQIKYLRDYGSLKEAITAIGRTETDLIVTEEAFVSANTTVPANIRLNLEADGSFTISRGVTLAVENGNSLNDTAVRRIFRGDGDVKFSGSVPYRIFPEWFGVVAGNDLTEGAKTANVTAMQKAIDSVFVFAKHKTGVFYFGGNQQYEFNGMLDADGRMFLTLTSGTAQGATLLFTGTGSGSFISLRSAYRVTIENLDIAYNKSAYTGNLINLDHNPARAAGELGGDAAFINIRDSTIRGVSASTDDPSKPAIYADLLRMNKSIVCQIERTQFYYGRRAIVGVSPDYSNVVSITKSTFVRQGEAAIKNAGESWTIDSNTFEPLYHPTNPGNWGAGIAYTQDSTYSAYNITFANNWIGDTKASGTAFKAKGYGINIVGNRFELYAGSTSIEIAGGSEGVAIKSNRGNSNAQIVFTGPAYTRGVSITGNTINATPLYSVTGRGILLYDIRANSVGNNETSADQKFYRPVTATNGITANAITVTGTLNASGSTTIGGGTSFQRIKHGVCRLVAGNCTIRDPSITANSRVFLTGQDNRVRGSLLISARRPSRDFVITSSNPGDSGVVAWQMIEP